MRKFKMKFKLKTQDNEENIVKIQTKIFVNAFKAKFLKSNLHLPMLEGIEQSV